MSILVTGGAGYIGSHTVKALVRSKRRVVVIDDLSTGDEALLPDEVVLVKGDFADPTTLSAAFAAGSIDSCIHFAAKKDAADSVFEPALYYAENVGKSIDLLRSLQARGVHRFVFSSSAAVYGDPLRIPLDEGHPTVPMNPYGRSKLFFERVLTDVSSATNLRSVSLRYFNAGGADVEGGLGNLAPSRKDLISVLMESAAAGRPFYIHGTDYDTSDGTPVRDLVHVADLAEAHVLALDYLERGGESVVVNLGTEHGFTVREVVEMTRRVTGVELDVRDAGRRPGDIGVSVASAARARSLFGWTPRYSDLETIVSTAWAWETDGRRRVGP